jgi:uncharacterized SAM-binding protein YcdF (DUF218 family)
MKRRWLYAFALVAALGFSSNWVVAQWVSNPLLRQWRPVALSETRAGDAIVVLGGGIGAAVAPDALPILQQGASRYWYAARLFHAGKAPVVVAVGGNARGGEVSARESVAIAQFLVDLGVPPRSIVQESQSSTTAENALMVRPILQAHGIKRVLLVTSASHMPRAVAIFTAAGIDVVPMVGDVDVPYERKYVWRDFLPHLGALQQTTRALHEYAGLLAYPLQMRLVERRLAAQSPLSAAAP